MMNEPRMTPAALGAFLSRDNLNGTIASSVNGIEEQEEARQKNFLESQCLPIKGDWDVLTRWGVLKGENIDSLFLSAKLPFRWRIETTDHSLWSNLLDDRGLIRAVIFYKAAFYDQEASITEKRRFYTRENSEQKDGIQFECVDFGRDKVVARFNYGTYGILKSDPTAVGFIFDGEFYLRTKGDPWDEFSRESVSAELAVPITKNEFDRKFHDISARYDLISASKKKAKSEADEWLNRLPTDDSQWSAEFDFPEYEAIA